MKDEQKDLLRRIRRNIAMRASDPQSDVRTSQALRADANAIEAALKEVARLERASAAWHNGNYDDLRIALAETPNDEG